jgi:hypothetical protein
VGTQKQSRNGDIQDIQAEPADEVDRAGITAFRDLMLLQPARQLIFIVRRRRSKPMRSFQALAVMAAGIALIGCNRPASTPGSLVALTGAGATPTEFFNSCFGDVVSIGFPTEYVAAGPSGALVDFKLSSATGGTAKVETYGSRRSTPAEAETMMRKLHFGLRRIAQEKGCQVEGPQELSEQEAAAGFTLKYSKQNNTGEVVVTRTARTEKEYQDKDGKPVYTIKVVVSEKVGKPAE